MKIEIILAISMKQMSCIARKPVFRVSDQAAQPQKMARGLKLQI